MSTLCKVIEAMIKKGNTDGLEEKIDVFYAAGKLTEDEYNYLIGLLNDGNEEG